MPHTQPYLQAPCPNERTPAGARARRLAGAAPPPPPVSWFVQRLSRRAPPGRNAPHRTCARYRARAQCPPPTARTAPGRDAAPPRPTLSNPRRATSSCRSVLQGSAAWVAWAGRSLSQGQRVWAIGVRSLRLTGGQVREAGGCRSDGAIERRWSGSRVHVCRVRGGRERTGLVSTGGRGPPTDGGREEMRDAEGRSQADAREAAKEAGAARSPTCALGEVVHGQ